MSIEKSFALTARFRSARLLVEDLRALERELVADGVSWRINTRRDLGTWSWKNVYAVSESLDDISNDAPKGRLHEFEMQAQADGQSFAILLLSREPRFVTLTCEGPGEEASEKFWAVSNILKRAEKRGEKWFYAAAMGVVLAFFIPLNILDQVGKFGLFYDEPDPPGNVGAAVGWAVASFFVLALAASGFWSWATASTVTLRPVIDTAPTIERAIGHAKGIGRWMLSVPEKEYMYKLMMLWSTVAAALCGAGGFMVALLK